jgi:hypothetical protein
MSLSSLFKECLPINRKEVYYTATVLPAIVCAEGFAHIHRLWELLGIDAPQIDAAPESTNIQFLTEYNAKQSIYIATDKTRFPEAVSSGETPDVLILIDGPSPLIVSIEAKMYDTVNTGELVQQLRLQRENVLKLLAPALGIAETRVVQVALLPAGMPITAEAIHPTKLLHWQQIVEKFADVASASYFRGVLEIALQNYEVLRNEKLVFHANMKAQMTGEEILKRYDGKTLDFLTMGRSGGITGPLLARDLASGRWRRRYYELNPNPPANPNWFAIEDFVARVRPISPPG